jgi:radical SAM superfamily enzyme YgiQ (UPF0313 family)
MEGALFGIESFHQDILKQMHKNEKVQAAFELAEKLNGAGLYAQDYYIIGLPPETPDSIAEDLRTLASLELDTTQITIVTPHPETEMWRELDSILASLRKTGRSSTPSTWSGIIRIAPPVYSNHCWSRASAPATAQTG